MSVYACARVCFGVLVLWRVGVCVCVRVCCVCVPIFFLHAPLQRLEGDQVAYDRRRGEPGRPLRPARTLPVRD